MIVDECFRRVPSVFYVVIFFPHSLARHAAKLAHGALFGGLCVVATVRGVEPVAREASMPHDDEVVPQPLKTEAFEALMASPPFTRSLNLSDSLVLTGVAHFGNHVVATVFDTETRKSQVVSPTPNEDGWQLLDVGGDPADMTTWTAKIQVRSGEVVSIHYQEPPTKHGRGAYGAYGPGGGPGGKLPSLSSSQAEEAKKAAVNYREGFSGDGYPQQPPPEVVEKLSRLSVDQREEINRQMIGLFSRGMAQEERRRIYDDLVNRASQGRR